MYRCYWTDNTSVRYCKFSHSSWNNADAKEDHSQRYQVSNIVKDFSREKLFFSQNNFCSTLPKKIFDQ